jgi:hypothetical protein
MAYRITYTDKGSIIDCSGVFSMQDIIDANGALHCYIKFSEHSYQIWNLLNAELAALTEDKTIERPTIDSATTTLAPSMKIALVARDDHLVDLYESYRVRIEECDTKWTCQLFGTVDSAEEWAVK